jgi:predicted Zn-dependent peptidase
MQDEPLSGSALKAAKKQLLGQLAISSDNGETQCLSMGKSLVSFGKVSSDQENREAICSISGESLQRVARNTFDPERTSSLIFL